MTGHALAKEQFEFKVKAVKTDTATADEAAELFGFKEGETEVTFKNNESGGRWTNCNHVKNRYELYVEESG